MPQSNEKYSINEIAEKLNNDKKKVSLIYAFNATGKTRLSMAFKNLINDEKVGQERSVKKVLYFNAYTEDLFTWENDLESDEERYLKYSKRTYFGKFLEAQGKFDDVKEKFQEITNSKIEISFEDNEEDKFQKRISFTNLDESKTLVKISRGEERIFVWSIFLILIETIISDLKEDKENKDFNDFDYIYIDDPISSLDDNYTISAALYLADLLKNSKLKNEIERENGKELKFIISTHHALFFEVLRTAIKKDFKKKGGIDPKQFYIMLSQDDGLILKAPQNNEPFGYHLLVKKQLKTALSTDRIQKYHFNLMRNLLEKTAIFLGYQDWKELPFESENLRLFIKLLDNYSHGSHADLDLAVINQSEVEILQEVFTEFMEKYQWKGGM